MTPPLSVLDLAMEPPTTTAADLRSLREATGADELMITTTTHGLDERLRSFELLADAWAAKRQAV